MKNKEKPKSIHPKKQVLTKTSRESLEEAPIAIKMPKINKNRLIKGIIFVLGIIASALLTFFFQDELLLLAIACSATFVIVTASLLIAHKYPLKT